VEVVMVAAWVEERVGARAVAEVALVAAEEAMEVEERVAARVASMVEMVETAVTRVAAAKGEEKVEV
jgi:hypothetical protein